MSQWLVIALGLMGLVISLILVYRRFYPVTMSNNDASPQQKASHGRFVMVAIVNIIAFVAMVLFILPIKELQKKEVFDVLITPGSDYVLGEQTLNLQQIESKTAELSLSKARYLWLLVKDEHEYSPKFIAYLAEHYQRKLLVIKSTQELQQLWQGADSNDASFPLAQAVMPHKLKVIGDGLNQQDWQYLNDIKEKTLPLLFYPSVKKLGVVELNWPREIALGQTLTLTGKLQKADFDQKEYQVSLWQHQQQLEQVEISETGYFQMQITPKMLGAFNYQMAIHLLPSVLEQNAKQANIGKSNRKLPLNSAIVIEDIAVNITGSEKPVIVIKQSSPSFETRAFRQWLNQTGSSVKVITQISRDKWSQHHYNVGNENNAEAKPDGHLLTASLLSNSDLLLLDSRAVLNLSANEIAILEQAVSSGLGVFINVDKDLVTAQQRSELAQTKLFSGLKIQPTAKQKLVLPTWPSKHKTASAEPLFTQATEFKLTAENEITLVKADTGRTLVTSYQFGLGKIAFSTITQTYRWALEFGNSQYSHYWQYILAQMLRDKTSSYFLKPASNELYISNNLSTLCLVTDVKQVVSTQVKLVPHPLLKYRQCGLYTQEKAGWHKIQAFDDRNKLLAEQLQYIYPASSFSAWQQANKHKESLKYSANNIATIDSNKLLIQHVNKLYLWLLLFFSLLFLWLERKWLTG